MRTTTVVIGAGHAGLAVSHFLTRRSIDHVVLERGEVANSWKTQRWDSLRLLTPNWQSRLPGLDYDGDDPDGFMTMPEVIGFIDRYAAVSQAPVRTRTTVSSVRPGPGRVRGGDRPGDLGSPDGDAGQRRLHPGQSAQSSPPRFPMGSPW